MRVLISLLLAVLAGVPVGADAGARRDPNDSPGPLDIRAIEHRHRGRRILHEVRTFETWRNGALSGDDDWIALEISTDRTDGWERLVWIRFTERHGLFGKLYGLGEQLAPVFIRRVDARRAGPNAVEVALTVEDLDLGGTGTYRWLASSSYQRRIGPCRNPGWVVADAFPSQGVCWDSTPMLTHDPGA